MSLRGNLPPTTLASPALAGPSLLCPGRRWDGGGWSSGDGGTGSPGHSKPQTVCQPRTQTPARWERVDPTGTRLCAPHPSAPPPSCQPRPTPGWERGRGSTKSSPFLGCSGTRQMFQANPSSDRCPPREAAAPGIWGPSFRVQSPLRPRGSQDAVLRALPGVCWQPVNTLPRTPWGSRAVEMAFTTHIPFPVNSDVSEH